jgi:hypothetical protein
VKREALQPTSSFTSDASVESADGDAKEKEAEPRRTTRERVKPQASAEGEAVDVKT